MRIQHIRNQKIVAEKGAEAQDVKVVKKFCKFDDPEFAEQVKSIEIKKPEKISLENL